MIQFEIGSSGYNFQTLLVGHIFGKELEPGLLSEVQRRFITNIIRLTFFEKYY